jgi:hypothetical protein
LIAVRGLESAGSVRPGAEDREPLQVPSFIVSSHGTAGVANNGPHSAPQHLHLGIPGLSVFRYGVLPVSGTPQPREYAASSSRIVPDEGRTFGFEVLYSEFGIYAPGGQRYTPVDAEHLSDDGRTDPAEVRRAARVVTGDLRPGREGPSAPCRRWSGRTCSSRTPEEHFMTDPRAGPR